MEKGGKGAENAFGGTAEKMGSGMGKAAEGMGAGAGNAHGGK